MYKRLELTLANRKTAFKKKLRFKIARKSVAQRWAKMLQQLLIQDRHFDKTFMLRGWPTTQRDEAYLCAELNRHIGEINQFFNKHKTLKYRIGLRFDAASVTREQLNQIHYHFETLKGQEWKPAKYTQRANFKTKWAIHRINLLCHELDHLLEARKAHDRGEYSSFICFSDVAPRVKIPLEAGDYEEFSKSMLWGTVYLHYAQTGKTHYEAFHDDDAAVTLKNISGLRYMSGEFEVHFGGDNLDVLGNGLQSEDFLRWLRRRKFEPDNPKLGIGWVQVAKLENAVDPKDRPQFMDELHQCDDLVKIRLVSDTLDISAKLGYHWADQNYERLQLLAYFL